MDKELEKEFHRRLISLELETYKYLRNENGRSAKEGILNDISEMRLMFYAELHTDCKVGKFNAVNGELTKYDLESQLINPVHYDFVVPNRDESLIILLKDYNREIAMSVEKKTFLLDQIKDRICELKGILLYWDEAK